MFLHFFTTVQSCLSYIYVYNVTEKKKFGIRIGIRKKYTKNKSKKKSREFAAIYVNKKVAKLRGQISNRAGKRPNIVSKETCRGKGDLI